ncbi:hypothetical protein ALCH109712_10455 [Alkalicoccus chagannorensis]
MFKEREVPVRLKQIGVAVERRQKVLWAISWRWFIERETTSRAAREESFLPFKNLVRTPYRPFDRNPFHGECREVSSC